MKVLEPYGWMRGYYLGGCTDCSLTFIGSKDSYRCPDCAGKSAIAEIKRLRERWRQDALVAEVAETALTAEREQSRRMREALEGLLDAVDAHNVTNGREMVDRHAVADARAALTTPESGKHPHAETYAILDKQIAERHPRTSGGACGMRFGDRVIYTIDGRHGRAGEFMPDGDADVYFDDGTYACIKWSHLKPEVAIPKGEPEGFTEEETKLLNQFVREHAPLSRRAALANKESYYDNQRNQEAMDERASHSYRDSPTSTPMRPECGTGVETADEVVTRRDVLEEAARVAERYAEAWSLNDDSGRKEGAALAIAAAIRGLADKEPSDAR